MKPVEESSPRGKDWLVLNLNTKKVQYFKKYDDASKHVKKKGGIVMTSAHYEDNKGLYESENTTMEITEKAKEFLNRESIKSEESECAELAEGKTPSFKELEKYLGNQIDGDSDGNEMLQHIQSRWGNDVPLDLANKVIMHFGREAVKPKGKKSIRSSYKKESVELEEATDIWSKEGLTLTRFAGGKDLGVLFQLSQERSIGDKKYSSSYIVLTPEQVKGLFGTKIRGVDYKMK
mgnify:CR=1 FL=1